MIGKLIEDVGFHNKSLEFFAKLKADHIFTKETELRRNLNKIITWHKNGIIIANDEIQECRDMIKKLDTPVITPDGREYK